MKSYFPLCALSTWPVIFISKPGGAFSSYPLPAIAAGSARETRPNEPLAISRPHDRLSGAHQRKVSMPPTSPTASPALHPPRVDIPPGCSLTSHPAHSTSRIGIGPRCPGMKAYRPCPPIFTALLHGERCEQVTGLSRAPLHPIRPASRTRSGVVCKTAIRQDFVAATTIGDMLWRASGAANEGDRQCGDAV